MAHPGRGPRRTPRRSSLTGIDNDIDATPNPGPPTRPRARGYRRYGLALGLGLRDDSHAGEPPALEACFTRYR